MAFLCTKRGAQSPFLEIEMFLDRFFGLFGPPVGAEKSKFCPFSDPIFAGHRAPPKPARRPPPRYTHPAQPRPENPPEETRRPKTARRKPPEEKPSAENSPESQKRVYSMFIEYTWRYTMSSLTFCKENILTPPTEVY
jgi:hypothetical protein